MKKTPGTLTDNAGGWYAVTESDVLLVMRSYKSNAIYLLFKRYDEQKKNTKVLFLVIQILFILLQKQNPPGGYPAMI